MLDVVVRRPVLAFEQIAHRRVGVDRLDVAAHERVDEALVAEILRRLVEPHLRGLRGDGPRGVEHPCVARAGPVHRLADLALHVGGHREHDDVEVLAGVQGGRLAAERVYLVLQALAQIRPEPARILDDRPRGLSRPRRYARRAFGTSERHVAEGLVLARELDLAHDVDRRHRSALPSVCSSFTALKKRMSTPRWTSTS